MALPKGSRSATSRRNPRLTPELGDGEHHHVEIADAGGLEELLALLHLLVALLDDHNERRVKVRNKKVKVSSLR